MASGLYKSYAQEREQNRSTPQPDDDHFCSEFRAWRFFPTTPGLWIGIRVFPMSMFGQDAFNPPFHLFGLFDDILQEVMHVFGFHFVIHGMHAPRLFLLLAPNRPIRRARGGVGGVRSRKVLKPAAPSKGTKRYKIMEQVKYRCPYCGSNRTGSKGFRKTVTLGLRPRRHCHNCEREFTVQQVKAKASAKPGSKTKRKR